MQRNAERVARCRCGQRCTIDKYGWLKAMDTPDLGQHPHPYNCNDGQRHIDGGEA